MTLGDLLKQYRENNKISMDEFSKRSTLSKGYISMLENNINPRNNKPIAPTLPTIQKIASGMGTDVDSVLKVLDGDQNISLENDDSELKVGIGKRIKEARENLGLTQNELAELVGVTGSAITNYEKETSQPKGPIMYKLLESLNVDANYLFQDVVSVKFEFQADYNEQQLIKKYRALDEYGKETINIMLDRETERTNIIRTFSEKSNSLTCKDMEEIWDEIPETAEELEAKYPPIRKKNGKTG